MNFTLVKSIFKACRGKTKEVLTMKQIRVPVKNKSGQVLCLTAGYF
jgi:hypothetical protein